MGTRAALISWARGQVGVTENPPGSNRVRYWDDIGMHGLQGQPWCAAFYLAGLTATGTTPVTKSVYVPTIHADYQSHRKLHPVSEAQPADQVLYRFGQGHTGVIVSVNTVERTVTTVEGNTVAGTAGRQDNGGGVFLRHRPWSDVWAVGRPDFTPVPEPTPAPTEDDMQRFVIDVKGPDDQGRDSVWEVDEHGNIFNWNGARPLKSRVQLDPGTNVPVAAAVADPSGDGVVPFGADPHQDERGHWVRSSWKILVGM